MKEKYLTAEQIHKTKKVGDKIIFKNNLIESEIIEIGVKKHFAESFFGANNVYQDIKFIHFLYGNGEKISIYSHSGILGYTALLNNEVYAKNEDWNEYFFMCGDVYKENQKNEYKNYLKIELDNTNIDIVKYNEMLSSM